jgi:ligand-binding sensor domain-containing protein
MRFFLFILTIAFSFNPFLTSSIAGPLKKPLSYQHITQKEGLSSNMVFAIGVQGDEVWFGTYEGGATHYNRSKKSFRHFTTKGEPAVKADDGESIRWKNHLAYNHVSVITPDVDRIWFGTYFYGFGGGGISYYHPQKNPQWKPFNTNDGRAKKVNAIAVDGESLWVGSEKGISLLDKTTEGWKQFFSTRDGLSGNFVNSILIEPDAVWMATNGGISRLQKAKRIWKNYSEKEGLTEIEIKALAKVGQRIWAGGSRGGLFEYDSASDRWKRLDPADPLKNGGIQSIAVTREKVIVCRDNGASLYDLPTKQWESLTAADGLLSNTVFYAAEDGGGIWFGTDKGASKLILTP